MNAGTHYPKVSLYGCNTGIIPSRKNAVKPALPKKIVEGYKDMGSVRE